MTSTLLERAKSLKLYGMIAHWEAIEETVLEQLIDWEETERTHRGITTRLSNARIGRFKPLAEFDWNWPKKCDREAIEELMGLDFIRGITNIIICGPNGAGKSTIAQNIAHQAVLRGHSTLFTTAGQMLNELASQDGDNALRRRIQYYAKPKVLVIDEVGYLSYSNRHADLMFEVIARRYQTNPTIVTTNKPFGEWGEIFPNASCVVSLIDRLVHNSEIIGIEADSYRLKEAKEQTMKRKAERTEKKNKVK
ncbi:MAG: IS21-like element helper ATPase IstB [Desulfosporosinus sp.]|nr:IS21-like element helper ATPase IstB [Desulfosporosinus sp.]